MILEDKNNAYFDKIKNLEDKSDDLSLEKKNLSEKLQLYIAHNATL